MFLPPRHRSILKRKNDFREGESVLEIRKLLESEHPTSTCLAILDCLSCQNKFVDKFERSPDWLLTRAAAEQATDSEIARWRANLLFETTKLQSLTELGCGIGGDTVFLAQKFHITAFEANPGRSILAHSNLQTMVDTEAHQIVNESRQCGDPLW